MTPAQANKRLAPLGLHLTVERDATEGHEYTVVETGSAGRVIASGWSGGTKSEAVAEAISDAVVARRLAGVEVLP